jgi:hypothetical protein
VSNFDHIRKNGLLQSESGLGDFEESGGGVYGGRGIDDASSFVDGEVTDGSLLAVRIKPSVKQNYKIRTIRDSIVVKKDIPPKDLEFTTDGKNWKSIVSQTKEIKGITDIKKRGK